MAKDTLFVDMHIDDLAEFMFMKNINDAIIEMSLGGVENTKDLFCFFVDLMCKGLVLLFGKENRIELDQLSMDDFKLVQHKMSLAGIAVNLNIEPNSTNLPTSLNIRDIDTFPDNNPISSYFFVIISPSIIYKISFGISRNMM
jgi:hypothetical protein